MDLINESVHTADDVDIGDIDAVNIDFVVLTIYERGFVVLYEADSYLRKQSLHEDKNRK